MFCSFTFFFFFFFFSFSLFLVYFDIFHFQDDMVVVNKRREKMARYDKLLKQFQHSRALDAAMEVGSPEL